MKKRRAALAPIFAAMLACGSPQTSGSMSDLACGQASCNRYTHAYQGRTLGVSSNSTLGKMELDVAQRVNQERAKIGLPSLKIVSYTTAAAQKHAIDQALTQTMSHVLYGKEVGQRLHDISYQWQAVGENVAQGQRSAEEVMRAWMNSSGHRANILSRDYTAVGVGVEQGKDGQLYFTQVFAKPMHDIYN